MLTLANTISGRGHAVDLVLANADGAYLDEVCSSVRIVNLSASRVVKSLFGLVSYLRRERPIALLSAMSHANVIAVLAHRIARVPARLVVSEHANFSVSTANTKSIRGRVMRYFVRWAYPYADAIVPVSLGVAEDLVHSLGLSRSKIKVIYNPVADKGLLADAKIPINNPWFGRSDSPIILGAGRLVPQKDFSLLIRAFARVRKSRPARLVILGEGEMRMSLEKLVEELGIADDVLMPGFVDNPITWMSGASIFVLSSAWEGFGNVLVEAMLCGLPVVSTDCPSGPAEILDNGRWGRLVPVGDETSLVSAIEKTMDDVAHPDVVQRALDFSIESSVDAYLQVLSANESASC